MKHLFTTAALIVSTQAALASTVCNVNTYSEKPMEYNRTLFSAEVAGPKYVLLKKGATSAREIDLKEIDTIGEWNAINGSTIISFVPTSTPTPAADQTEQIGISVAQVDMSKTENILPLEAMAIGPVTASQFLYLILPKKKVSVTCISNDRL